MKGFKQFMLRGNVIDLAVAVVMGAAFGAVVTALVKDLITPLIAAIVGKPDFSAIQFTVNNSKFLIGDFINALISFLLIGAAVYFFVVLPVNTLMAGVPIWPLETTRVLNSTLNRPPLPLTNSAAPLLEATLSTNKLLTTVPALPP